MGFDVGSTPGLSEGARVALSIRPERLRLVADGGVAGTVKTVMPLGAQVVYEIELAAPQGQFRVRDHAALLTAR
jgi:hypothetical protein